MQKIIHRLGSFEISKAELANLQPRPLALSQDDFLKIEKSLNETFDLRPTYEATRIPIVNDNGEVYRHEHGIIISGATVIAKETPNPKLLAAILRPATRDHIAAHLTRLAAHRRWTRGDHAFGIVIEDISRDLAGISEWAMIKTCEELRANGKWFPETDKIILMARMWDGIAIKISTSDQAPTRRPATPENISPKSRGVKSFKRVARILKIGAKEKTSWTAWEIKFMAAIKERADKNDSGK